MNQQTTPDASKKYQIQLEYVKNDSDVDYCADEADMNFCTKSNIQNIDMFEQAMDQLEKAWHNHLQELLSNIKLIVPEQICDMCSLNTIKDNPLLVCQGCGITTHRDCYGSFYSEEDFFLCQPCIFYYLDRVCVFCNKSNGLMKLTTDFRFGHLLCVMFCNTLDFDNQISKEPIALQDYKMTEGKCMFCNKEDNHKIECSYAVCMNIYHVECALDKAYFDVKNNLTYCDLHDPSKKKRLFCCNYTFKNYVRGYAELKDRPVVRKSLHISECIETEYTKIVHYTPAVYEHMYDKLKFSVKLPEDVLEGICKYWIAKRTNAKRPLLSSLRFRLNDKTYIDDATTQE